MVSFCELASALKEAKPRFDPAVVKLIAVGVGTPDKARILATRGAPILTSLCIRLIAKANERFPGTRIAYWISFPAGRFLGTEQYSDDVSLLVLLLDTNPLFWSTTSITFSQFLSHVLAFLNAVLGLNQLNQVVVIATGYSSCDYIYDSYLTSNHGNFESSGTAMPALFASLLKKLEDFVTRDEELSREEDHQDRIPSCLLSGSLSMALCYIQRVFRSGHLHPQPRILCLQGSPDGPEQYVAVMNSIFSAQRLMVPIDSCYIGVQNSAFLQQASYITGGVHHTPKQLDGLFQYLTTIFATDLHSRGFVQLPKPVGVDFRASCFCHKKTIDMGYICSVCLSIFCQHHKKCSTCGSVFGQSKLDDTSSVSDKKRKAPA